MIEIIPAIMPQSYSDLTEKLSLVAAYVPTVQIDVMDGVFVKSRSWPYYSSDRESFNNLLTESEGLPYWDTLDFEVDLMVSKPEEVIDDWITAGAARIIVHIESTKKMDEIVKKMRERFAYGDDPRGHTQGVELGVALDVKTPVDEILPYLEDIECVQFMGIDTIGLQGQMLNENVRDTIRAFHTSHPEIVISVDGGVTLDNARDLVEDGVKRLVSGSAIFESGSVVDTLEEFRRIV